MELTGVPSRTVELAASGLPGYIAALPRLLTNYYVLRVSSGTVDGCVVVHGFYGPGAIWIISDGELILNHGLSIQRCSTYIRVVKIKFRGNVDAESNAFVYLDSCPCVSLEQLDIDGEDGTTERYGITARMSNAAITDCSINNMSFAVRSTVSSVTSVNNLMGAGNAVGGQVYRGGVILLAENTPNLMGGASNSKKGGLIVKSDGTLL